MTNPEWMIYGLIQINFEEEGYSAIIEDGETKPSLKVPGNVSYGWKHLTAIYSDEFKKVYHNTLKRTKLYHGSKVWVNCPCIFVYPEDQNVTLKADVFSHNRRVPSGQGTFLYNNEKHTIPLDVEGGYVEKTLKIPSEISFSDTSSYSFIFDVNYDYELAPDMGVGLIFVNSPFSKNRLTVDVGTVICNLDEWVRLSARVYRTSHASVINYPDDIPSGGYIVFYVDGKKIWFEGDYKCPLNDAGFASIKFKSVFSQWFVGTHTITATYYPDTPELESKFVKTSGCGTLFIGTDTNKPSLSLSNRLCTFMGNNSKSLIFSSDSALNGKVEFYLDNFLMDAVNVNDVNSFSLSFDTLGDFTSSNAYLWNFPGYHNCYLKYITDDGGDYPMEYYYYFDDFYIQTPVELLLEGELDNTTELDGDTPIYVGNNLYYMNGSTPTWFSPNSNERGVSTTIGNVVRIRVNNDINKDNVVDNGFIRLTFVSRTENNDMEDNING